jgi:hypothetical protein
MRKNCMRWGSISRTEWGTGPVRRSLKGSALAPYSTAGGGVMVVAPELRAQFESAAMAAAARIFAIWWHPCAPGWPTPVFWFAAADQRLKKG